MNDKKQCSLCGKIIDEKVQEYIGAFDYTHSTYDEDKEEYMHLDCYKKNLIKTLKAIVDEAINEALE